jgi:hypothetical protein
MPSTRGNPGTLVDGNDLPDDFEDDYDADYRESSADEDDELPKSMARDRAEWVVTNQDAVEEFYRSFRDIGFQLFGRAFFQAGNVTSFSHFLYKYTTPGAA